MDLHAYSAPVSRSVTTRTWGEGRDAGGRAARWRPSAGEGARRTGGNATVRPLLAGVDDTERYAKFKALMTQRVPLYRRVATIRVNTNRRNPGAVVRHIVSRLGAPALDSGGAAT